MVDLGRFSNEPVAEIVQCGEPISRFPPLREWIERLPIPGSQPREIPGTENRLVLNPMFAPDGESIAFIESSRTLKRVSIGGGPVSTIASLENQDINNATWGPAGILIIGRSGILRVSPEGGVPDRLIGLGEGEVAYGPHMLPDGRTILFTLTQNPRNSDDRPAWDKAKIVAQSLTTGTRRVLIDGGADARYLPSGHLLYAVGGTMFAAPAQWSGSILARRR